MNNIEMQKIFVDQVITTLDKKEKSNYFLLIGMGIFLDLDISKINEIIEIVRNLLKKETLDKKIITEFIFQKKPSDEKYI
ncbi:MULTISPECIES: hypothetical protein [Bacteria]|uniref:hypothetical protein n=1 Tax=Bacteria TaxID=2 RepID=UPI002E7B8AFB|nr:hypothetical protein [Cetobacterium somerae]WVJ03117.1 hypothetical protein VSU16_14430 [Cetobacterium somerae]